MKTITLSVSASLVALLIGTASMSTQADARRGVGVHPHARAHVAAHNVRHYNRGHVANRYWRRGRWVNGVWVAGAVATGVAVGAAAASNNCGYYWNRWKATGSSYWRNRYHDACG
jgi:hypothetical protein